MMVSAVHCGGKLLGSEKTPLGKTCSVSGVVDIMYFLHLSCLKTDFVFCDNFGHNRKMKKILLYPAV